MRKNLAALTTSRKPWDKPEGRTFANFVCVRPAGGKGIAYGDISLQHKVDK